MTRYRETKSRNSTTKDYGMNNKSNDQFTLSLSPVRAAVAFPLRTSRERITALGLISLVAAGGLWTSLSHAQTATTIESSNGGVGADVTVQGTPGDTRSRVGLETNGLIVRQNGAGTGLRIVVGGSGEGSLTGVRSIIGGAPQYWLAKLSKTTIHKRKPADESPRRPVRFMPRRFTGKVEYIANYRRSGNQGYLGNRTFLRKNSD
jgi:hypothetical protein